MLALTPPQPAVDRPFLKWAGGKHKLVGHIFDHLPTGKRLIEPFAGSGVVAINAPLQSVIAGDANEDLINLYMVVQNDVERLILETRKLFSGAYHNEAAFKDLRNRFNRSSEMFERSTIFIYLNRHCFNGLCRYNSKGEFNVPFGRYKKVMFPEVQIRNFHAKSEKILWRHDDFEKLMDDAEQGDVIYCDPPYVPVSASPGFNNYHGDGFGLQQQERLARAAERAASRGIPVLISNNDTGLSRELYKNATSIRTLEVQKNISCDGSGRAKVRELTALFA